MSSGFLKAVEKLSQITFNVCDYIDADTNNESEEFSEISDDSDIDQNEKQQLHCSNRNIKFKKTNDPVKLGALKRKLQDNQIDVAKKVRSTGKNSVVENPSFEKTVFLQRKIMRQKIVRSEASGARKRKCNIDNWIDVQAKKARSSGVAGVSRTGVPFKAKAIGAGCGQKCRFKCHRVIDMDDRNYAHQIYWSLKDQQSKWQCILNWIKSRKEKPLSSDDTDSSDDENLTTADTRLIYRLPKIETLELVKVCRTMFLHTLGIHTTLYFTFLIFYILIFL